MQISGWWSWPDNEQTKGPGLRPTHKNMNLNFAAGSDLIEFADLGGDDVIQEPVDRLVVVEHQEELDEDRQAGTGMFNFNNICFSYLPFPFIPLCSVVSFFSLLKIILVCHQFQDVCHLSLLFLFPLCLTYLLSHKQSWFLFSFSSLSFSLS